MRAGTQYTGGEQGGCSGEGKSPRVAPRRCSTLFIYFTPARRMDKRTRLRGAVYT